MLFCTAFSYDLDKEKPPKARGCGGSKMRADAASAVDRYGAGLTRGGACLHAATEAAAEKQRRRRLALRRQSPFMKQILVLRLKACQRGCDAARPMGIHARP